MADRVVAVRVEWAPGPQEEYIPVADRLPSADEEYPFDTLAATLHVASGRCRRLEPMFAKQVFWALVEHFQLFRHGGTIVCMGEDQECWIISSNGETVRWFEDTGTTLHKYRTDADPFFMGTAPATLGDFYATNHFRRHKLSLPVLEWEHFLLLLGDQIAPFSLATTDPEAHETASRYTRKIRSALIRPERQR